MVFYTVNVQLQGRRVKAASVYFCSLIVEEIRLVKTSLLSRSTDVTPLRFEFVEIKAVVDLTRQNYKTRHQLVRRGEYGAAAMWKFKVTKARHHFAAVKLYETEQAIKVNSKAIRFIDLGYVTM